MNINEQQWKTIVDTVNEVELKSQRVNFNASKKMTVFQLAHEADILREAIQRLKKLVDNANGSVV